MNPQRRKILATLVMSLAVAPAIAQRKAVPQAGTEYQVLAQPLPLESATKVEVIEFFSDRCKRNRFTGNTPYRQGRAATGIAVEF